MSPDYLTTNVIVSIIDSLMTPDSLHVVDQLGESGADYGSFDLLRAVGLLIQIVIAGGVLWAAKSARKAYLSSLEALALTRQLHTDEQRSKRPYFAPANRAGYLNLQINKAASILTDDSQEGLQIHLINFGTNPIEKALGHLYLITKAFQPDKFYLATNSMEVYAANPLPKGQEWIISLTTEEVIKHQYMESAGVPGLVETFIWMELTYRDAVNGQDFEEDLFWAVGNEHKLVEPSAEQHHRLRALAMGEKKFWAEAMISDADRNSDSSDPQA